MNDKRAALRDLHPFVDVGPRILAADDVFRGRKEPPDPERDKRDRHERGARDTLRRAAKPQSSTRDDRARGKNDDVRNQKPAKAVAMKSGETDDGAKGQSEAEDDGPEAALLRVELGTPVAIQPRQPENCCAGQPPNQRQLCELNQSRHDGQGERDKGKGKRQKAKGKGETAKSRTVLSLRERPRNDLDRVWRERRVERQRKDFIADPVGHGAVRGLLCRERRLLWNGHRIVNQRLDARLPQPVLYVLP